MYKLFTVFLLLSFSALLAQFSNDRGQQGGSPNPFGGAGYNTRPVKINERTVTILVGKGIRLTPENQAVINILWAEIRSRYTLSLDGDLQSDMSGAPLIDNEESLDAFYRFLSVNNISKTITTTERCSECKGSGQKVNYLSKPDGTPGYSLAFQMDKCAACSGEGKQPVNITYIIICDAKKVPLKVDTPRKRILKDLAEKSEAGDVKASLLYASYLLNGTSGFNRDVDKSKSIYQKLVLSGEPEALLGLANALSLSFNKNNDDDRFARILFEVYGQVSKSTSAVVNGDTSLSKDIVSNGSKKGDELDRKVDAIALSLNGGVRDRSTVEVQQKELKTKESPLSVSYLDYAVEEVLVSEFSKLFKTRLLTKEHLSYLGFIKEVSKSDNTNEGYKSIVINWALNGKRNLIDSDLLKKLKANASLLDYKSLAFLAGVAEEGLISKSNPTAAFVLYKMAYVQSGKEIYLEQAKRVGDSTIKDLTQQMLLEFEKLRRDRAPLVTFIDSVLKLK